MKRFKASLIVPETLIQYQKDRFFKVFLYIGFFALLTSIGPLIRSLSYTSLPTITQGAILSGITYPESCEIVDSTLTCEDNNPKTLYQMGSLNAIIDLDGVATVSLNGFESLIRLEERRISIYTSQGIVDQISYEELNVINVSFSGTEQQQVSGALSIINALVLYYRPVWTPVLMVGQAIGSLFIFMIFALINAAFLKPRLKQTSFKELFTLMAYASSGLYLI